MSKLENISALLVATNSAFTKEAAFTTKTTRAELIRMLQATDFAVSEALEVAENYVKVSDQLFEDKEKLSAEVQELNSSHVMQLEHLQDGRNAADFKHVGHLRFIFSGRLLGHEHDPAIGIHGRLQGLDAFGTAHEQGDHHMGEYHHIAQRQQWQIQGCSGQGRMSRHGHSSDKSMAYGSWTGFFNPVPPLRERVVSAGHRRGATSCQPQAVLTASR